MSQWINVLMLVWFFVTGVARADNLKVAVAANFAGALEEIAKGFEAKSGHKLTIISGATGKFFAQIRNGAPFDVLLSADQETPKKLENEGFALQGTGFTYAIGHLVLWSNRPHFVDRDGNILSTGTFRHISVANPKTAPYGAAAMEVIRKLGLEKQLEPKIVQGENIAQTHQFIVSGNAELGFVSLSQVYKNGQLISGSAWFIPGDDYNPIRQDAIVLRSGASNPAARDFLAYLRSKDAQEIMASFGYSH